MAIKVTRTEKPSVKCRGCGAKLEFEFSDLVGFLPEKDYTSDGPDGVGVKCPECKDITEYKKASGALIEEVWAKKRARK